MQHDEQVRVLRTLMNHIDQGSNVDAGGVRRVPATVYTAKDRAEAEWDKLFAGHPQIIGLSGDLPAPGDFITRDDVGVPILATRAADGRFRAFANVCRHRGTILESAPRGHKSRFSCPFHAWTYANTGELIGLPKPEHFGEVDRDCLGLVELPAIERHGFLWVHPRPDGVLDVAALNSGLDAELESWSFGDLTHVGDDVYETAMNWKLAIDTFGETYHFETLHRDTLAQVFHGNVQAYDTYGRNHRMSLCVRTIDGLRETPEAQWRISDGCFPVYYLFPNVQVNVGAGSVILVRVYPVRGEPGRSVSRVSFYADRARIEAGEDPTLLLQRFAEIIRDEDYVAAAASQRGADSGLVESFLFGRNEPALHHYHTTYHEALGLDPIRLEPA